MQTVESGYYEDGRRGGLYGREALNINENSPESNGSFLNDVQGCIQEAHVLSGGEFTSNFEYQGGKDGKLTISSYGESTTIILKEYGRKEGSKEPHLLYMMGTIGHQNEEGGLEESNLNSYVVDSDYHYNKHGGVITRDTPRNIDLNKEKVQKLILLINFINLVVSKAKNSTKDVVIVESKSAIKAYFGQKEYIELPQYIDTTILAVNNFYSNINDYIQSRMNK